MFQMLQKSYFFTIKIMAKISDEALKETMGFSIAIVIDNRFTFKLSIQGHTIHPVDILEFFFPID
jgi:hypothetical protein